MGPFREAPVVHRWLMVVGVIVAVCNYPASGRPTEANHFEDLPQADKAAAIGLLDRAVAETDFAPLKIIQLGYERALQLKGSFPGHEHQPEAKEYRVAEDAQRTYMGPESTIDAMGSHETPIRPTTGPRKRSSDTWESDVPIADDSEPSLGQAQQAQGESYVEGLELPMPAELAAEPVESEQSVSAPATSTEPAQSTAKLDSSQTASSSLESVSTDEPAVQVVSQPPASEHSTAPSSIFESPSTVSTGIEQSVSTQADPIASVTEAPPETEASPPPKPTWLPFTTASAPVTEAAPATETSLSSRPTVLTSTSAPAREPEVAPTTEASLSPKPTLLPSTSAPAREPEAASATEMSISPKPTWLPATTTASARESEAAPATPSGAVVEHSSYIDESDPNNPMKVELEKIHQTQVDDNGDLHHEQHQMKAESTSLGRNPNGYSRHSTSSSSAFSRSNSLSNGKQKNRKTTMTIPPFQPIPAVPVPPMPTVPMMHSLTPWMPVAFPMPASWPQGYYGNNYYQAQGAFNGPPPNQNNYFGYPRNISKRQVKKIRRKQERAARKAMANYRY